MNGNAIRVGLATDSAGAVTSTAAQVVAALNAYPPFADVATASLYRTSPGDGVVAAGLVSPLSDLLRAPATFPRGPQDQWMLRIGKHRDASKVGIFLYCQEHGNEIATSGVCLETAERLLRNYGRDVETTELVDGLDIFIVPQINGDGATHSLYDSNRRTNLSNHCEDTIRFPAKETDPAARNNWGVDLNRNFSRGSVFDGYFGASATDCTNGNFAGLFEFSEPETRNESWVQTTFRNIKFVNNIHSSGGYFMWPPGAYVAAGRVPLPYPPYGTLNYFDQTGKEVLDRIKSHRGTAIRPQQTGPVIDVLYSAAGNSADEAYYSNGIIGYDFEIGAQHYNDTGSGTPTCNPGQQPPFGDSTNDCLDNEGFHEAMEFASGNYGLLEEALEYSNDTTAPSVEIDLDAAGRRRNHELLGALHERRGGVDLLHARRLDPDHGLDGVQAATGPGAARAGRGARGRDAQVDRARLQGQHVRGQVAGVHPAGLYPRRRERHGAAHAVADAGRARLVRGVHARHRPRLPGVDVGQRDLDGGRRDAVGRRSVEHEHGPAGQRHVRARAAAAGATRTAARTRRSAARRARRRCSRIRGR